MHLLGYNISTESNHMLWDLNQALILSSMNNQTLQATSKELFQLHRAWGAVETYHKFEKAANDEQLSMFAISFSTSMRAKNEDRTSLFWDHDSLTHHCIWLTMAAGIGDSIARSKQRLLCWSHISELQATSTSCLTATPTFFKPGSTVDWKRGNSSIVGLCMKKCVTVFYKTYTGLLV